MTKLGKVAVLIALAGVVAAPVSAGERWVSAVTKTEVWGAFPCTDYWITNVCGTDKTYDDPGSLPPTIRVGDTLQYTNKKGKLIVFRVRSINFFVYDKDVDTTWGGKRLTAKKGDTSCYLYDIPARSNTDYASKIAIPGCRLVQTSSRIDSSVRY
jgi:hypothetical protein